MQKWSVSKTSSPYCLIYRHTPWFKTALRSVLSSFKGMIGEKYIIAWLIIDGLFFYTLNLHRDMKLDINCTNILLKSRCDTVSLLEKDLCQFSFAVLFLVAAAELLLLLLAKKLLIYKLRPLYGGPFGTFWCWTLKKRALSHGNSWDFIYLIEPSVFQYQLGEVVMWKICHSCGRDSFRIKRLIFD